MNEDDLALVFSDLTSPVALLGLWRKEASKSETRGRDGLTPADFAKTSSSAAHRLSANMQDGTYRFIAYRQVLKVRGASRPPREVSIPAARDRAPLKALLKFLHATVEASRGALAQQRVRAVSAALKSGSFKYFLRLDIKDFYPSILHREIKLAFERESVYAPAERLLFAAVRTPTVAPSSGKPHEPNERGVPQGLPISNAVAELVMSDLDREMGANTDIVYFRYVDDILILSRRKMHRKLFREVQTALTPKGLECHSLKSLGSKSSWGKIADPVDFLGYRLSNTATSVRAESVSRLKSNLVLRILTYRKRLGERPLGESKAAWEESCAERLEWFMNISITGCVLDQRRRGWIHYFSLIDDFGLLRDLDFFVTKKLKNAGLGALFEPKSFVSGFRRAAAVANDKSDYLPDFDSYDVDAQRQLLHKVFRVSLERLLEMTDVQVQALFYRRLRRELDSLETDLAIVY